MTLRFKSNAAKLLMFAILATSHPAMATDVSMDFSFRGSKGCVSLYPNPEIRFKNIPSAAKSVLLTLHQGERELGGQEIPVPPNGVVPAGTIRSYSPCNPGLYEYRANFKSSDGRVLANSRQSQQFP